MKYFLFAFVTLLLMASTCFSQANTFYMDPGTIPLPFAFVKDSCGLASDSNMYQFTPPITMYYRGFTLVSRIGGAATFRFIKLDNTTASQITSLDSLVTTASAVNANIAFTSARAGAAHTQLVAGTPYRIEFISPHGEAFIKPSFVIWCTLN